MSATVAFLLGVLLGAGIVLVVVTLRRHQEEARTRQLLEESQRQREAELNKTWEQLKMTFAALSREALSSNTEDFLKLAQVRFEQQKNAGEQTLETKKKLIDARLQEMDRKLTELNRLIQTVESQRSKDHGSLRSQIEKTTEATQLLSQTTGQLREALANPQRRGQWGERMAEDVLRLAGLVEGINYEKQQEVSDGTRPDFTFLLPDHRKVHMDVKFPLANYLKMLEARDDHSRKEAATQFLKDVRSRIKEVTTRGYIDPAAGTVDYMIVFIPNEQIYGFIHQRDGRLMDDALRQRVVLSSPMSLYAIVAIIRQAVDNFHLEQSARQILELLSEFKKQWGKYSDVMDKMGNRLEQATEEYRNLVGVRTRQLDRQLDKIDHLRSLQADMSDRNAVPAPGRTTSLEMEEQTG